MVKNKIRRRVAIQQSVIPHYAVPLFEGIGQSDNIELIVSFEEGRAQQESLSNHGLQHGRAVAFPSRQIGVAGLNLHWQSAQWRLAAPAAADVLILEWNTRFLSLIPSLLRAKHNGIRTVLWGHGYSKRPSRLRDWLRGLPARLADALILYDEQTAQRYRASGLAKGGIYAALNALDDRQIRAAGLPYQQAPARLAMFRAKHELPVGNTLLFVGRLYPENDLPFLLKALGVICAERPACRLIVIGDGTHERPRLQALAAELGLTANIHWVGALYSERDIAPWALCADLLVYPKNVGLSLIHGFNYGLPAVVSGERSAHNPEIFALEHDVNGLLIAGQRPHDYAAAVIELLADDARRARLAAGALRTVQQRYNMANLVNQFVAAIRASPADSSTP